MLNPRLTAVASFLPKGTSFADIGTDHASLPIFAVQSGIAKYAIACDFNEGPYLGARQNIKNAQLEEKISVRRGSGLEPLRASEVDIAVFSGMGGLLINELLKNSPAVLKSLKGLILQPQLAADKVRKNLYELGWHIKKEALAKDSDHLYQIIFALPGKKPVPSDFSLKIGPCLLQERPASLWDEYLDGLIKREEKIICGLKNSCATTEETLKEKIEFLEQLENLKND